MDQDAFRKLLAGSRQAQSNAAQGIPTTPNSKPQKASTSTLSGPAFKPRKVKKGEGKYRDRAAERREGIGNDFAQVEAVLEDFERRVAHEDRDAIEQQRRYLGGDSQHTILVKGLDMSLLEQNRVRATASTDDEVLEQAFAEAASIFEDTEPRKRTREDIIRDLKVKRQNKNRSEDQPVQVVTMAADDESALKKVGKFKPIGFKPIAQTEEKSKKRRIKEGKEGVKKKKKKTKGAVVQSGANTNPVEEPAVSQQHCDITEPPSLKMPPELSEPEPIPLDKDLDIFAGAGDYEGFPGDESEEKLDGAEEAISHAPAIGTKGWFGEPEYEISQTSIPPDKSLLTPETIPTEDETRLKPLESSALPSIRDFLAMDEAAEKVEKWKARKEKKKKKPAGDDDDD